ncbi:hypothetical protein HY638_04050 [Candidatus Woesearchaeota archaeon]|nr:hypothetical protein [Candidatus Woesearchaeota archaeon]
MESLIVGASAVAFVFYLAYRLMMRKGASTDYDKWYDGIVNSKKYKVKGQYDE